MLNAQQTIAALEAVAGQSPEYVEAQVQVIMEFKAYLEATYAPTRNDETKTSLWAITWKHTSSFPIPEMETFYKDLAGYDDETLSQVHQNMGL